MREDTLWVLLNVKWNCKLPLKSLKMKVFFVVLHHCKFCWNVSWETIVMNGIDADLLCYLSEVTKSLLVKGGVKIFC